MTENFERTARRQHALERGRIPDRAREIEMIEDFLAERGATVLPFYGRPWFEDPGYTTARAELAPILWGPPPLPLENTLNPFRLADGSQVAKARQKK